MIAGNVRKVGIIGAGVAGLATARTLLGAGFGCTVFERAARLGGVWADGYSNFGVQVQKELYEFPDWPLPSEVPDFTPGPVFQQYLEDFVDHFGVRPHIRLSAKVSGITPLEGGAAGWRITWWDAEGTENSEDFDRLVIATGLYSNKPHIPDIPGRDAFQGEVLHNSKLKTPDPMADQRVAIIGFGKSATDAALESGAVAREVHLIFRQVHWPVPRNLAGLLPFKWGMLNRMTAALIEPYMGAPPLVRLLHGLGKPLPWIFWRAVELLLYLQFRLWTKTANGKALVPKVPVEIGCFDEATMVPRPALYRAFRQGRVIPHLAGVSCFTKNGLALTSGEEIEVDKIICATGWQNDHAILPEAVHDRLGRDEDGFYLYRHILNPDLPNLFFIGRASTFLSVLTYSLQARWLAELLKGEFGLPARADMLDEISRMKDWKRAWMPANASRGARVLLHQMNYHDELLRDFGARPYRKRGLFAPLKELLAPYQSSDYRDIVSGRFRRQETEGRAPHALAENPVSAP
jgi:dimethylaniline monooxygenase (N-oxide forming)